ncbi:MAG: peptidylprolyl isomerase, partial [Planctomycetota bacterium]
EKVEPTDEERNRAFLAEYGEAVKCRMIMVSDPQKANQLHQQATANPETFGALAKQHSEDEVSASVSGLIPPIRRYTGDSRLEEAAFALEPGQISPVMQLADQWVIMQAVRRIPQANVPPTSIPAIREQINDRIRDQKMKGASTELFQELHRTANVINVLEDPAKAAQYPGVAAVVNNQSITLAQLAAECVKRHGNDVLEGEINRKLLTQALRKAGKTVTQADIDAEIARAAKSFGFIRGDGSADIQAWNASVVKEGETTLELYIEDSVWPSVALRKLVADKVSVTEADIQRGYESKYGPRVEVLACVLADQRTAQKVWKMARDNPAEHFFARLAEDYSVEPVSASNSGKVPPIRKYSGQPTLEREAFKLKPNELSGIIATGDKYILLRCQGYTTPVVSELSAVRSELVQALTDEKYSMLMGEEFDRLRESADIDNFFATVQKAAAKAPVLAR